jgi:hypothetical protein
MEYLITRTDEDHKFWEGCKFSLFPENNPEINSVIFRGTRTIVKWTDGEVTISNTIEGEFFDKEKGLAMAIVKKFMTRSDFNDALKNAYVDTTVSRKEKKNLEKKEK